MSFEVYDGAAPRSPAMDDPQLTIKSDGKGYLNRAADQRWFVDVDEATFLVDREATKLAIAPGDRDGRCYALSREADYGADLSTEGVLTALGLDPDPEALPQWFTPVWSDDLEAAVVDLSPLVDAEPEIGADDESEPDSESEAADTDAAVANARQNGEQLREADDADESDRDGPEAVAYWLGLKVTPGQTYALEASEIAEHVPQGARAVAHHLRTLRDGDDEFAIEYQDREGQAGLWRVERAGEAEEADQGDDGCGEPTLTEQARAAVEEDGVRRLTELADRLGVTPGTARSRAMDADVYSRLRDDDISRPGVDR